MDDSLKLMAVFAHPDDEAFGVGGTLTKYAAEGCDVYLVSATRGEAGQILAPGVATKANLPYVREQELRCACQTYGIHPPMFMDYLDGQLTMVNQGQAVGKLVRILREIRPQVVITFGPDGIYGHYDHIAVHHWTTIAVDLAEDPNCFPNTEVASCKPHHVSKLYYRVLVDEQVRAMSEDGKPASVEMDGVPFYVMGYPREQITTVIDVSQYRKAKEEGMRCHITQIGLPDSTRWIDDMARSQWFNQEAFILARPASKSNDIERDLFAGLR